MNYSEILSQNINAILVLKNVQKMQQTAEQIRNRWDPQFRERRPMKFFFD